MKDSPQTRAVHMATDDVQRVIASFGHESPFMTKAVSRGTQARHDRIANAPADIRALLDAGHSMEFVDRLSRLVGDEGMT